MTCQNQCPACPNRHGDNLSPEAELALAAANAHEAQERAAFEHYWRNTGQTVSVRENGLYQDLGVQAAWSGWFARAVAALETGAAA